MATIWPVKITSTGRPLTDTTWSAKIGNVIVVTPPMLVTVPTCPLLFPELSTPFLRR